ncbi:cytochrome P450 81Q32-like [Mercurialis annua]|uniref:cytochrome P450 81Q32-like n=1 Tax=Mercurialis annua TaxID=3986 RepID=UPI00215F5F82|nr:cytochrome P450 81Q32-like [Mercurialis annua]
MHSLCKKMEQIFLFAILSTSFFLLFLIHTTRRSKRYKNLPPSPPSLPIIGHLHLVVKNPIQRTLHNLSRKYGPIIHLKLGTRLAVIVSSPSAVEECLTKNNDIVFANRPQDFLAGIYLNYNNTTLVAANYGDHWINLRRITAAELFSSNRLNKFLPIRTSEVNFLLQRLHKLSGHGFAKVELRPMFFDLTTNIIMRMVAGKRYHGDEILQLKMLVKEVIGCTEMTNIGDVFPRLQWLDFGGFRKKLIRLSKKVDSFLQELIDELRIDKDRDTMINHLLVWQETQPDYYSDELIKGLVLVMLLGGAETTSLALEWAMANLLNNPTVLNKAKAEIDNKIGQNNLLQESDLTSLNYLQNIIYENLRLCPVAPLLAPHMSSSDCTIGGFHVPANTMLMINIWAVQRDPQLWEDPTSFKPERFENGRAEGFEFLPFGLGRRGCPGKGLAYKEMGLALGSLIQCFEWEKVDGREINMSEKTTLSLSKVEPLEVMCKARPILHKILLSS